MNGLRDYLLEGKGTFGSLKVLWFNLLCGIIL
jgi:hypothetical protein